jgi:predicted lipid-binding transport protein (Tim44 family)
MLAAGALLWLSASEASARVGGGHTYSGGGHSGGGGSDGGDGLLLLFWIFRGLFYLTIYHPFVGIPIDIVVIYIIVACVRAYQARPASYSSRGMDDARPPRTHGDRFEALRKHDPNFSEVLFTDFVYALYARAHEARGRHDLATYAPYLAPGVIADLEALAGDQLKGVSGIVVGAMRVLGVSNPERPAITVTVLFEANYTETVGGTGTGSRSQSWYTCEVWTLTRRRDVLSRPPESVTALHCPNCGGALERKPDGSCAHCGVKVVGGDFDWFVTRVQVRQREAKGPLLTADVPEEGTDRETVYQTGFAAARQQFMALNPDFSWPRFEARARHIFVALQQAWSEQRWEQARPYETDNVFQMHLYWITEYKRQHLRNVVEDIHIGEVVPVKVVTDPFFDAVTLRVYARMLDYTTDEGSKVICGGRHLPRAFSEYWTFIRRRGVKARADGDSQCPNCGAPLKVSMAGVCEYCQGKVTSGEFDWVLSRIEQDESYEG